MLGGQPDQTEHHKEDNWSSSQTPSCCKQKNQTCLPYPATRVVCNVWQDRDLQQKLKQQMAMTKLSAHACALKEVQFGQLDLQKWQTEAKQIRACLVVDCRGVYDAVARSSFSCLGFKDKNLA